MPFRIQNWKLAFLATFFIAVFTSMGFWQLSRATEKKILLKKFALRTEVPPLTAATIKKPGDWRFYQTTLVGEFDNARTIFLDNKTHEGKIGYEVYSPFRAQGLPAPMLIDRGFIPASNNRKELPVVRPITGNITITGMLNLPPSYVNIGKLTYSPANTWPLRVEYINLTELAPVLQQLIFPYVLNITPTDPAAYSVKWQIVAMQPEKHMGYALQWFAFALTLLILFVALNRPGKKGD